MTLFSRPVSSQTRPIRAWIQSLDEMRRLEPEVLVPSHTGPLIGKDLVAKQLTDYRDGIAWVFVETIRVRGQRMGRAQEGGGRGGSVSTVLGWVER